MFIKQAYEDRLKKEVKKKKKKKIKINQSFTMFLELRSD